MLYKALINSEIPVDMHLFSSGGHGFNYGFSINSWLPLCIEWLTDKGLINSE
jgi:dipeptidyl aminopeptidase/acylaminoacyl peptidase